MPLIAPRMGRFQESASTQASARARELKAAGRDVIALTVGEPDFPTPDNVKEAAVRAMARNETKYTNTNGTTELRQAIRAKFRRDNGLDYPLDRIAVGNGAKQVIANALVATVSAGDEVILPTPYWITYPSLVRMAGGAVVEVACPQNNGFKLRAEDLEAAITPKTKWLILNSPGNPSGAIYGRDDLRALADVLLRHPHVWVLADDIYEHLRFDGIPFATIAEVEPRLYERTVTVNGVSKAYSMTGWRIGYAGVPKALIRDMSKLQSLVSSAASSVSQAAAVEALNGPQDVLAERRAIMQERRDAIFPILSGIDGLSCHRPEGAMYIYCNCAGALGRRTPDGKIVETDEDFTLYLLHTAGVAVVHGAAYGLSPYVRVSFAVDKDVLKEAGRRIDAACRALA
jgi:aspartate aminotransferase